MSSVGASLLLGDAQVEITGSCRRIFVHFLLLPSAYTLPILGISRIQRVISHPRTARIPGTVHDFQCSMSMVLKHFQRRSTEYTARTDQAENIVFERGENKMDSRRPRAQRQHTAT